MKKFNLRKKILALTLTAITMFSTVAGILPGSIVHAADATSGTYYGINWDMDAEGNLVLHEGTCTDVKGDKWSNAAAKTVKCDGEIICNDYFCIGLFKENKNLVSVDLSGFNTSNVTNMTTMFYNCYSLTSVDVSSFNTSNVANMGYMFNACTGLTSLDLSNFNTSNVTNMESMFYACQQLTSLDLSNFNTSNVTNMSCMFDNSFRLTSLDLSNFNTRNVTNMQLMFAGCSGLTSLDLSSFDTDNVKYMERMFYYCSNIKELNLSSFNISKVITSSFMFHNCNKLEVLTTPKTVGTTNITLPFTMYDDSNSPYNKLVGNNVVLYRYMHGTYYGIDWTLDAEGNLTLKGGTCTFVKGTKWKDADVKTVKCDGEIICNDYFCKNLFDQNTNLVSADLSKFDTGNVTSMYCMFYSCSSLTSLNLSSFNTSNVTEMSFMFYGCNSLTSLDISNFNTSNATDMSYMFAYCKGLPSLDVSGFNTSNVTNMKNMFYRCDNVTSLDLSSFDGSSLSNADGMISECLNLKGIIKTFKVLPQETEIAFSRTMYDLSDGKSYTRMNIANATLTANRPICGVYYGINWILDSEGNLTLGEGTCNNKYELPWKYTDVKTVKCKGKIICNDDFCTRLFYNNKNLISVDLSGFDTSNVTRMDDMFHGCSSLTSLDLSGFDTSNVTRMDDMFSNCSSLTSLDLSNFNTNNVTNMNRLFSGCQNLTSLDVSHFNTSNVTDMGYMFYLCSGLISLDVSNFNTSNVDNTYNMFNGCSNLTSLDVSNFDTSKVTSAWDMFLGCDKLEVLTTPKILGTTGIDLPFAMYNENGKEYNTITVTVTNTKLYKEPQFKIFVNKTVQIKGIAIGSRRIGISY